MTKRNKKFTAEFKREAVQLMENSEKPSTRLDQAFRARGRSDREQEAGG